MNRLVLLSHINGKIARAEQRHQKNILINIEQLKEILK